MRTLGWAAWTGWSLFALCAVACDEVEGPPTDVHVSFKTDFALGTEISALRARVYKASDTSATGAPVSEHTLSLAELNKRLPLVIEKRDANEFLLAAQALGPGGVNDVLVERQVRARFVDGQSVSLQVFLARACQRKACTTLAGETCFGEARGSTCEGSCATIEGPEALPVWTPARSDWQPASCQQPAPFDSGVSMPRGSDAGDEELILDASFDAGSTDASVVCAPSTNASCNAVTQCGCADGKSCGIVSLTGTSLQLGCIHPGTLPAGMECSSETCVPGHACVGSLCRPFCSQDADCGSGGHCVTATTADTHEQLIPGLRVCFAGCAVDNDCQTGCCRKLSAAPHAGTLCLSEAACCVGAGTSCTQNDDCCGYASGQALCVSEPSGGAICRATCVNNAGCQSNCCAPLSGGGSACFAISQCRVDCSAANESCETGADCCGGPNNTQVCVDQGSGPICADHCTDDVQCPSGCCAPLQAGGKVCAPSTFCP